MNDKTTIAEINIPNIVFKIVIPRKYFNKFSTKNCNMRANTPISTRTIDA